MTVNSAAAAAAAAAAAREAARRAAELAAKKAAEAAARKAAQAAAQAAAKKAATNAQKTAADAAAKKIAKAAADHAAQALSKRAGQNTNASAVRQAFGKDELSRGLGTALRARATNALGSPSSVNELRAPHQKVDAAEAQRDRAAKSVDEANRAKSRAAEAQQRADRSGAKLERAQDQLDTLKNKKLAGPGGDRASESRARQVAEEQKKVDALATDHAADQAQAKGLEDQAEVARKQALGEQDKAITAQHDANAAAKAAGQNEPFKAVADIRDASDLASRDPAAQKKVLGGRSVASPQEAARADALRVKEATAQSPQAGAAELRRQVNANTDPEYRRALVRESKGSVDAINRRLATDPNVDQPTVNHTLRDLSAVGEASPESRKLITDSLAKSVKNLSEGNGPKIQAGLKDLASDPAGARFDVSTADSLRGAGRYAEGDQVSRLDPKLATRAKQDSGEQKARNAVDAKGVDDKQRQIDEGERAARDDVKGRSDKLFDQVKNKTLPRGFKAVPTGDPNRVEVVRTNKDGKVLSRSTAVRDGDQVRYERTVWNKSGTATRERAEISPDRTYSSTSKYEQRRTTEPGPGPSVDTLKKSQDANATVTENEVLRQGGKLQSTRQYTQNAQGISETKSELSQKAGHDDEHDVSGIEDNIDNKFDGRQPTDVFKTETTTIPRNTGFKKGQPPIAATVTRSTTYSQGNTVATSSETATIPPKIPGHGGLVDKFNERARDFPKTPTAADLDSARDAAGKSWGDDKATPKTWKLETSANNTYKSQQFIEGSKDHTIITERTAKGAELDEKVKIKGKNADGDKFTATETSKTRFDQLGRVESKHVDTIDQNAVRTVGDYDYDYTKTKEGLRVKEAADVQRYEPAQFDVAGVTLKVPGGPGSPPEPKGVENYKPAQEYEQHKETSKLYGKDGPQLESAESTLTGPDGSRAHSEVSPKGEKHTFTDANGNTRSVDRPEDLRGLNPEQQKLATAASSDVFGEVSKAIGYGKSGLTLLRGVGPVKQIYADNPGLQRADLVRERLYGRLESRFGSQNVAAASSGGAFLSGAAGAAKGAFGLVSSTKSLVDDIRSGNELGIAQDAVGIISGGKDIRDGFKGASDGLRYYQELGAGVSNPTAGVVGKAGAVKALGSFGTVLGVASGVLDIAAGIDSGQTSKIVQGSVSIAGTVAAAGAAGAIGGPLGALAGAGIGLAVVGVNQVVGLIFDDEHQIADVEI